MNGELVKTKEKSGFAIINVNENCEIDICFKFSPKKHVEKNHIWFSRGSVVYSKAIKMRQEIDATEERQSKDFPAYNTYAVDKWNYGVKDDCEVKQNMDGSISVDAYEIDGWGLEKTDKVKRCVNLYDKVYIEEKGDFVFTPTIPLNVRIGAQKKLTLTPYGFAKLRITAFPKV